MVQNEVKEEMVEEQAAEPEESVPEGEVESQVAEIVALDWSPLSNDKLEVMGEDLINEIMSKIPGLSVETSPNHYQKISCGSGRGKTVAKIWFAKSKACVETPILEGRKYVVGQSRYLNENGLSQKNRASVIREIKKYIADRGWTS